MSVRVVCTVDNCHYWFQGNVCGADKILITGDDFAADAHHSVDATRSSLPSTPARTTMDTCCKSFTPRGAPYAVHESDDVRIRSSSDEPEDRTQGSSR